MIGPEIMGGKAGSDSGQSLVQNRLKPRSGSDKIEPAAGGAQTGCPDKKYSRGMAVWHCGAMCGTGWVVCARGSIHKNNSAIQYNMRYII